MSMRQRVGRQEIEQFLIQVGRTRQPDRPPYDRLLPNLSQQRFSQHYQAVRQLL